MKKEKCMSSLLPKNKKVQGNMSSTQEWNTKHPLSDDAVVPTALGHVCNTVLVYVVQLKKKKSRLQGVQ